jgi:mRNA-degrading endonuclease toxin of MazEF toxin-antitoxin module
MRRGDLVTVAASGDYGQPRPAVIVQTDAFPENHASVVVCQLTSELAEAPDFRVTIEPRSAVPFVSLNGLEPSQRRTLTVLQSAELRCQCT